MINGPAFKCAAHLYFIDRPGFVWLSAVGAGRSFDSRFFERSSSALYLARHRLNRRFARLVCLSRHCLRGPLTWFSPLFVRSFSRLPFLERSISSACRCWRNRSLPTYLARLSPDLPLFGTVRSPGSLLLSTAFFRLAAVWQGPFVRIDVAYASRSSESPLFARLVCLSRHCLRGPLTWFSPLFVRSFSRLPFLERSISSACRCWRNRSLPTYLARLSPDLPLFGTVHLLNLLCCTAHTYDLLFLERSSSALYLARHRLNRRFARLVCLSRHCLRGPLTWFPPLFVRFVRSLAVS